MTAYIKAKYFRNLDKKSFLIENVYDRYRSGGIEVWGKFVGKTFVEVDVDGKKVWKEKKWDSVSRTWEFVDYEGKFDKDFFSVYKKVFDVEVSFFENVTFPVYSKEEGKEVPTVIPAGEKVVFNGIASSKIKTALEDLDLDGDVELIDGKDKAGNPSKVKPFDWEDETKNLLIGQIVEMRVRGEGMDTKYSFKTGKKPAVKEEEIDIDSIPF